MNRFAFASMAGLLTGIIALMNTGCDWSSGGGTNSFNTSQGAGVNINFSGFYRGELAGGKVVDKTSGGNILALTISQTGNRLTVIDNQGSTYSGSVGAPGLVANPDGTIPAGAEFVQSQISFSGKDGVSARDIEFVGILHAVSVRDIQGKTTEQVSSSGSGSGTTNFSNSGSASSSGSTTTRSINNGSNTITRTEVVTPIGPGSTVTVVTEITTDNDTGRELDRSVTTTRNEGAGSGSSSSQSSSSTTRTFTDFQITEANTQYRLEGTWIEKGGFTSTVKARSPGASGTIQTTSTETTETP